MKPNLLVSFSGGETSAFMAQWIQKHLEDKVYKNVVYVFANTGLENEQTLEFVKKCDDHFNFKTKWIQARTRIGRKSTSYWHIDFETAARKGEPFEELIQKYGIPNQAMPHCTRELKQNPIKAFARDYFNGEKYDTAIGIRSDEADRMNAKAQENGFIYPLINRQMIPTTKPMVNFFWKQMPFRLELKGYQGNCLTCWKKSDKKLFQIVKENPQAFEFMDRMEETYPFIGTEFKKEDKPYQVINDEYVRSYSNYVVGDKIYEPTGEYDDDDNAIEVEIIVKKVENKVWSPTKRTFFRGNRSAKDIIEQSKSFDGIVRDDAKQYNYQIDLIGGESCEVFSECGS